MFGGISNRVGRMAGGDARQRGLECAHKLQSRDLLPLELIVKLGEKVWQLMAEGPELGAVGAERRGEAADDGAARILDARLQMAREPPRFFDREIDAFTASRRTWDEAGT